MWVAKNTPYVILEYSVRSTFQYVSQSWLFYNQKRDNKVAFIEQQSYFNYIACFKYKTCKISLYLPFFHLKGHFKRPIMLGSLFHFNHPLLLLSSAWLSLTRRQAYQKLKSSKRKSIRRLFCLSSDQNTGILMSVVFSITVNKKLDVRNFVLRLACACIA